MPVLVCFHAHPDDEAIATGGLMAQTAAAGGRGVLVVATRGERGQPQPGVLSEDDALWEHRIPETFAAAEVLGVDRVEFLGYVDSGMMGESTNDFPYSFWQSDIDRAARRLAAILTEENQTRIEAAMAEQAAALDEARAEGVDVPELSDVFGKPEDEITHGVDVTDHLAAKRAAMAAHSSQISSDSWFLSMEDEMFAAAFGTEWYIETGVPRSGAEELRTSIW